MMYHPQTHIPLRSILGVLQIGIKSQDTVMSDSEDFTVTYTEVSSPFEDLSDIGSPGVVGAEYEGLPWMLNDPYVQVILQAPPSLDYVPGPEEPEQAPPLPDFVLEPVYPEFMPLEDEVLPAEEKPLLAATLPTADLLGYVPESDPEEDQEEDDEEDPEEDLADYPTDGGDDGDDEDESSNDDEDDDVDIEEDEEEEEHPAPADSTAVALPTVDQAPSAEETKPFETDESADTPPPHPAYRVTARMSIRDEPPTPFWSEAKVARLLAIPSPPPSPLSPWSSLLPRIPSPPLPVSPLPLPVSPTYPLGYRAAMIRLRAEALSTSHSPPPHIILSHTKADTPPSGTPPLGKPPLLPIPLPTSSLPLHLLSIDCRADRPEVTLPPRKRVDYGFVATIDREIMQDLERNIGYGITDTSDEMLVDMPGAPATDETELGRRMTEFTTRVRQDTDEIYVRLDDEQTERQLMAGRLNMLYRDRRAHDRTTLLIEREARMSREVWERSMNASDLARSEVMSLRTIVLGQQAVITELQAADRRRQATITELLAADRRRQAQFIEELWKRQWLYCNDLDRTEKEDDLDNTSPSTEIKNLEVELMFLEESKKIERYVGGLPDMIHGSVVASKPKTMQEATEIATELIDKRIRTFAKRQT
ncbi:hypothetical protein Tco_0799335 [Tanacetum coccineum]|uniref:Uncharacterized protein n=1 Tax=Tanacetum coccineum TaxID=301880 RepID=A0ABQ4ZTV4_9ASTR